MSQCAANKRDGTPCKGQAVKGSAYCFTHAPDKVEERAKRNAKGGRLRPRVTPRVEALWSEIEQVIADVRGKRLTPSQANSMIRGYNALVDLAKFALEAAELQIEQRRLALDEEERTELKRRMDDVERGLELQQQRGYRGY